jgi:hypothetical protein
MRTKVAENLSSNRSLSQPCPLCYTVRWRAGHVFILRFVFVAIAYLAWLYAHSGRYPYQSLLLPGLVALAANTWVAWSAFDHDYPTVKRWRDSFGIAVVVTVATLFVYMMYLVYLTYG